MRNPARSVPNLHVQHTRRSPEDAAAFVRHLQSILRHIGASDANMDRVSRQYPTRGAGISNPTNAKILHAYQGELRCDVNVSVQRTGRNAQRGTRCEVKNLNGVRFLMAAIGEPVSVSRRPAPRN